MVLFKSEDEQLAERTLRGQATLKPIALLGLAKQLKRERKFSLARKLLGLARHDSDADANSELNLELAQQHALCTYKDPDLPADQRLDRALEILQEAEDLHTTRNQETLGLAGSIQKKKWEVDGQRQHLEASLAYYLRGYHEGVPGDPGDRGYTGINAAFVLDLLADQEPPEVEESSSEPGFGMQRRAQAKRIREDLAATLTVMAGQLDGQSLTSDWWFLVTLAEAYYGCERYEEAKEWLKKAAALPGVPEWEFEATARQLASIARMQAEGVGSAAELLGSEAWEALEEFLGNYAAGVRTAFIGKIGLALSGGGFRASLFHIGVLAKLADFDILRHVEVLSCVSGGSIIGAHYYLEVRELLRAKPDSDITREDYVAIVQKIERDFLRGVQRNIRTRVAAELSTSLKMMMWPGFSRTVRAGQLFEREIFSRVGQFGSGPDFWLNDLFVIPKSEPEDFKPKSQNWRRRAKVPILVLNATTLNTGHVWQFTASWMGEPPGSIDTEVDCARRLRRMYYHEAPRRHRRVHLGHAVAASASVPGLFDPVPLNGLYPDMTVRLVDGGVHDNQGVGGLLEQDCTVLLVSDASGQKSVRVDPGAGVLGVPLRANSILMARVREAQYHDLDSRLRSSLLRDVVFVHLKKDLDESSVAWIGCQDPPEASDDARPRERRGELTRYGIRKDVQARLAELRTDLDSFCDAEAHALMVSGYRMMEHELTGRLEMVEKSKTSRESWRFLDVEHLMQEGDPSLMLLLAVGRHRGFKIWRLSPALQRVALALTLAASTALITFLPSMWRKTGELASAWWSTRTELSLQVAASIAAVSLLILLLRKGAVGAGSRIRDTLGKFGLGVLMIVFGWIPARLHLWVFDRMYLARGRHLPAGPPAAATRAAVSKPRGIVEEVSTQQAAGSYDVFISYSSADRRWAERLHDDLTALGIIALLPSSSLREGPEARLFDTLRSSRSLVVLWSEKARYSDLVSKEVDRFCQVVDPHGNGSLQDGRAVISLILEGDNQMLARYRVIYDLLRAGVYARSADAVDSLLWHEVVKKAAEAIQSARSNTVQIAIPAIP